MGCRFEGRKKRSKDQSYNDKQRLIHAHKKEMKGAMREIRKDNVFLAKEKLKMAKLRYTHFTFIQIIN